jgi:hypothetical protein
VKKIFLIFIDENIELNLFGNNYLGFFIWLIGLNNSYGLLFSYKLMELFNCFIFWNYFGYIFINFDCIGFKK